MMGYEDLAGFENVYLEDSFVLSVQATPSELVFEVDVVLTPGHPQYRVPSEGEQHCYLRSAVAFRGVRCLGWIGQGDRQPTVDPSGSKDFGGFDRFEQVGDEWLVGGDWGEMTIDSGIQPVIVPLEVTE